MLKSRALLWAMVPMFVSACLQVQAVQVNSFWNASVSGDWTDPTRWSTNPDYPNNGTPVDTTYLAQINAVGSNYTISFSSGLATLDGLNLNSVNARLRLSGGTLNLGAATVSAGTLELAGGTHSGLLTISAGGVFDVTSGTAKGFTGSLQNLGTMNFASTGTLNIAAGSITNSGTINLVPGSGPSAAGTLTLLTNTGWININANTGNYSWGVNYQNSGTININSGTLSYTTRAHTHDAGTRFTGAGRVVIGSGSLGFTGAATFSNATTTFNSGTINSTGTLSLATDFTFNGGNWTGTGELSLPTVFNWNGGTLASGGTVTNQSGAVLNVGTASGKSLSRVLVNHGTVNFLNGASLTLNGGTVVNNSVMNFGTFGGFVNTGTSNLVQNNGTINVNPGTTGFMGWGSSVLVNSGTISVNGGTLDYGVGTFVNSAGSRIVGAGQVRINSFTTMNFTGAGTLGAATTHLDGGTISGAGELTLPTVFNWNGGTLASGGTVTNQSGAVLNVGTASGKSLSRVLVNHGTVNFLNGASLTLNGGTVVNNSVMNFGTFGGFVNTGTSNLVQNNGTINVNPGTTGFMGWGSSVLVNSGTISVNGGTLDYGVGTFVNSAGSRIVGAGQVRINSFTTMNFTGAGTLGAATTHLDGGTISGAGELTLPTVFNWNGGTLASGGTVTNQSGAVLNVGTASGKSLSRVLVNHGTVNFLNGASLTLNGGTVVNNSVMNFGTFGGFVNTGTSNLVQNNGTINVNPGTTGFMGWGSSVLVNSGTISVNGGTLDYGIGTFVNSAGSRIVGVGQVRINSFTTMNFTGAGTLGAATTNLDGGTISGAGSITTTGRFNWNSGTIAPGGTMVIANGGTLSVGTLGSKALSRILINNGRTDFVASASLTLSNGTFINGSAGTLNITSNPNFIASGSSELINDGTINVPSGNIQITAPFTNNGTINVGGPAPGGVLAGPPMGASASLTITNPTQISGNTLTGGTWRVFDDAMLDLPAAITVNNAAIILEGPAASIPAISGLQVNNGILALAVGSNFTTAGDFTNNGTVAVDAGSTLEVTGNLQGGGDLQLDGSIQVSGDSILGNVDGEAPLSVTAGSTTSAQRVRVPQVNNSGTLLLTANGGNEGVSVIDDLNFDTPAARVDLGRNDLIVKLGAGNSGTASEIRSRLSGGTTLFSSTAAADQRRVGYAPATSLFALPADWKGQPLTSDSLVLAYTVAGDANLDGKVNTLDFNNLAGNFGNGSNNVWFSGDFDYNGIVDSIDYTLLVGNYGQVIPPAASGLGALVPEPAGGVLLALISILLLPNRRRGVLI